MINPPTPNRRQMIQAVAAMTGAAALGPLWRPAGAAPTPAAADKKFLVGIHIAAHSLFDEGFDHCLDLLAESAGVNALFVSSSSYYGAMHRPKEAQGDHGVPIRDGRGRKVTPIFFRPVDRFYRQTTLRHGPVDGGAEYAGREIFAELAAPAQKRGMKILERLYEPGDALKNGKITGGEKVLAIGPDGQPHPKPCWNHPDYRAWVSASLTDLFQSYPLDGIQYGSERLGPISTLLAKRGPMLCYCEHCRARAKRESIDAARAQEGAQQLSAWCAARMKGEPRPADGVLVELLRHFMNCPELLAWEMMQYRSWEEVHKLVFDTVKAARPQAHVGRHIDHAQGSYDLLLRAAVPYAQMAADGAQFLKISTYAEIMGPRLKHLVTGPHGKTIFGDLSPDQALEAFYALMGLDAKAEPKLDTLAEAGMTPDYIYRETKRAVDGVAGKAAIYAAIALDIPVGQGWGDKPKPSDPEKTRQGVRRAVDAGASGIVICREYEENRLDSLKVVGKAIREALAAR